MPDSKSRRTTVGGEGVGDGEVFEHFLLTGHMILPLGHSSEKF